MVKQYVPEELWMIIEPLLMPEPPKPNGGRPGVPDQATLAGAHVHDSKVLDDLIDSIAPVKGKRGRPRRRPEKLHADKGYDYARCRRFLRKRGIQARIARRGVESSERLGRHRWGGRADTGVAFSLQA